MTATFNQGVSLYSTQCEVPLFAFCQRKKKGLVKINDSLWNNLSPTRTKVGLHPALSDGPAPDSLGRRADRGVVPCRPISRHVEPTVDAGGHDGRGRTRMRKDCGCPEEDWCPPWRLGRNMQLGHLGGKTDPVPRLGQWSYFLMPSGSEKHSTSSSAWVGYCEIQTQGQACGDSWIRDAVFCSRRQAWLERGT